MPSAGSASPAEVAEPAGRASAASPAIATSTASDQRRRVEASRGVRFTGETVEHSGMVRLATFADPDGNLLMLAENLAG